MKKEQEKCKCECRNEKCCSCLEGECPKVRDLEERLACRYATLTGEHNFKSTEIDWSKCASCGIEHFVNC